MVALTFGAFAQSAPAKKAKTATVTAKTDTLKKTAKAEKKVSKKVKK